MASPDARPYIDLTVYDMQPIDIYDAALEYARTSLPDWTPVTGSIEDAIVQSASYMTGQLLAAINRLPSGNIEGLLRLLGVERNSGTAASATVQIEVVDDAGYTIPAGTRCGYSESVNGSTSLYIFETVEDISIAGGQTTTSAVLEGVTLAQYPAIGSGEYLQLLSAVSSINSIILTEDLDVGANAESTTEFLNRGVNKFASMSEALVTPSQFTAFLTDNYSSVYRATTTSRLKIEKAVTTLVRNSNTVTATIGSHSLTSGNFVRLVNASNSSFDGIFTVSSVGATTVSWTQSGTNASAAAGANTVLLSHPFESLSQNGYVGIYVSDIGGASLSDTALQGIEDDIIDKSVAGLTIRVNNAIVVPVSIAVTVTLKSTNVTGQAIETAIQNAIDQYIHPDYWDWSSAIYKNEIIALVDRVTGVDRVVDVVLTESSPYMTKVGDDLFFTYKGLLPSNTTTVSVQ